MSTSEINTLRELLPQCWQADQPGFARRLSRLAGKPDTRALEKLRGAMEASSQRVWRRATLPLNLQLMEELPVSQSAEAIREAIASHQVVVVAGETGSGKTTQLPKLCLQLGRGRDANIGHTQPRRLAARTVARRLGEEMATPLGEGVGYQVRFEQQRSENSRVILMTDGMLLTAITRDPELREYDTLIIDEAHERSLNIDFLLGYLKRLLPRRPDLKLIITSATIDVERFARHFEGAPVIEVSGRSYPVEVRYRPRQELSEDNNLAEAVAGALHELVREGRQRDGDVLVFLSGEGEIREVARHLRRRGDLPEGEVLPLYARLNSAEQQRIFSPRGGPGWRIVLATNVAETSLTVPGIRYVVDGGTARISRYSYRSKVQRLPIEPISQASARQRAGRCGRVAPGIAIRLYEEADFLSRPEFTEPEIQRTNLASVILQMQSLRLGEVERFPFVDAPDRRLINDGYQLLEMLGAVRGRRLTPLGRQLARFPVDPRIARMLTAAADSGCLREMLVVASALTIQDPRERPAEKRQQADELHARFSDPDSDFLGYIRLWEYFEEQRQALSRSQLDKLCRREFLSVARLREWREVHRQLRLLCRREGFAENREGADYTALHRALLSGLLDQVAVLEESPRYLATRNRRLQIFPGSGLFRKPPKWILAAEFTETAQLYARGVARIAPDWLLDVNPALLKRSYHEPHWQGRTGRVMAYETTTLYGLTIRSRHRVHYGPIAPAEARDILIWAALVEGRYRGKAPFFAHNQALIGEVSAQEDKYRRRDLLASDEQLYAFYDARLPADITTERRLDSWLNKLPEDQRRCLHMQRADVMATDQELPGEEDFPDRLDSGGLSLPLTYRFEPGDPADGVTVTVPVGLLNRLPRFHFEWLVPGLLRDKCIALLKALPKQYRKRLAPVPEQVERALPELESGDRPLLPALAEVLRRNTGLELPRDAWQVDKLEPRHFMRFRVVDSEGQTLGEGRDLAALLERFAETVQRQLGEETERRFEGRIATDWDFGELPGNYRFQEGGASVRAYPALRDQGSAVEVVLEDSPERAEEATRRGVVRLLMLRMPQQVKQLRANLLAGNQVKLRFAALRERREDWLEQLLLVAAEESFLAGRELPRDEGAFRQLWEAGRSDFVPRAETLAQLLEDILERLADVHSRLKDYRQLSWYESVTDIRQQLQLLVFPGFITALSGACLGDYPRYLQALQQRLEKLRGNQQRDLVLTRTLQNLQQPLLAQLGEQSPGSFDAGSELEAYRWMLEEFRVSLFAQPLGTRMPVSEKRLRAQWQRVLDAQPRRA